MQLSVLKVGRTFIAAIAMLALLSEPVLAHRWFMRTKAYTGGTTSTACSARILSAALNIKEAMEQEGYQGGTVAQGKKAIRLDGVGYDDASLYLYCSDFSVYVITAHTSSDDDKFFERLHYHVLVQIRDTL